MIRTLLPVSRMVDSVNSFFGRTASWLVLAAILVSAGNALSRRAFSLSSNAWLELQWYLFGAVFMIGAAWTFMKNEHVRIDILTTVFGRRYKNAIEIGGHILFLIPFCVVYIYFSWDFFISSFVSGERSSNAGGLVIWPAKLLILVGFILLLMQAVSELIKRLAIMSGYLDEASTAQADEK